MGEFFANRKPDLERAINNLSQYDVPPTDRETEFEVLLNWAGYVN